MNVVILESLGVTKAYLQHLEKPFVAQGLTFQHYEKSSVKEQIRQAQNADCIMIANMNIGSELLSQCPHIKLINVAFTGVDHIDLEYAKQHKVTVCNAAGYSTTAVAELCLGNTISLLRLVHENQERCRAGLSALPSLGQEIAGKKVGIIGFGAIGRQVAHLFHACGAQLFAFTSRPKELPPYVTALSFKELLEISDIVSLHVPLTHKTKHLIGKKELALMQQKAILINMARGPIVDSQALYEALETEEIGGAVIDVYDYEPPLETNHILLQAPRTLVTPHIAYASVESMQRRSEIIYNNLAAFLAGEPVNVVI